MARNFILYFHSQDVLTLDLSFFTSMGVRVSDLAITGTMLTFS